MEPPPTDVFSIQKSDEYSSYPTLSTDRFWYRGEVDENNQPNGKGHQKLRDGTEREGEFVNGLLEGKGKITYPASSEGKWAIGMFIASVLQVIRHLVWPTNLSRHLC